MAQETKLIDLLRSIPNGTPNVLKTLPSLPTGEDDFRIDQYASGQNKPFYVDFSLSDKTRNILFVNPQNSSGFLWWKRASRLLMLESRFRELKRDDDLNTEEELFIKNIFY